MDSIYDLIKTNTIFNIKPNWARDPGRGVVFDRDVYEWPGTTIRINDKEIGIARTLEYEYGCLGKEQQFELEEFFYQRKGRYDHFWVPVWGNLFKLETDVNAYDYSLIIEDCRLADVAVNGQDRIYIELHDGSVITRKISSVDDLGNDTERINLVTYIDQNITADTIAQFTRLLLCRFDQDELELDYEGANNAVTSLRMIELVQEYQIPGES